MNNESSSPRDKRRARLEEELRENLKRRKEQARARRGPRPSDDAAQTGTDGEDPER